MYKIAPNDAISGTKGAGISEAKKEGTYSRQALASIGCVGP